MYVLMKQRCNWSNYSYPTVSMIPQDRKPQDRIGFQYGTGLMTVKISAITCHMWSYLEIKAERKIVCSPYLLFLHSRTDVFQNTQYHPIFHRVFSLHNLL